jgi:hypothetical protein
LPSQPCSLTTCHRSLQQYRMSSQLSQTCHRSSVALRSAASAWQPRSVPSQLGSLTACHRSSACQRSLACHHSPSASQCSTTVRQPYGVPSQPGASQCVIAAHQQHHVVYSQLKVLPSQLGASSQPGSLMLGYYSSAEPHGGPYQFSMPSQLGSLMACHSNLAAGAAYHRGTAA